MYRKSAGLKIALAQGIVAQVVFAGAAIIGGIAHPGYSHMSQAVSELTAAGAVNQGWLLAAFALMEVLTIIFGVGYFICVRGTSNALTASAVTVAAIGVVGLAFARFPMDQVGTPMTFDGRMHIVIVSVSAVLAISAVGLSGVAWRRLPGGRAMAQLSFAVLALMVAGGVISALVATNGWPGIGIWQRLNNGAFGVWQIATAVFLLRRS